MSLAFDTLENAHGKGECFGIQALKFKNTMKCIAMACSSWLK